jgi:tRNA(Ile)-lysidine synthetase-like protein
VSRAFEKVRSFVKRNSMLRDARAVVIAVSGGADSVALLDMLMRIASVEPYLIHVAHLNHLLRGTDSTADAEFVRALAERSNLPATIEAIDVRQEARDAGRGIEEVAREMRYNFLLAVAQKEQADLIATGHTMSDQAETFLMRLARGSGARGLASIRPVIKAHSFRRDEGHVKVALSDPFHPSLIRPLLAITREEVEEYCSARGLAFRTDASNASLDYARTFRAPQVLSQATRMLWTRLPARSSIKRGSNRTAQARLIRRRRWPHIQRRCAAG